MMSSCRSRWGCENTMICNWYTVERTSNWPVSESKDWDTFTMIPSQHTVTLCIQRLTLWSLIKHCVLLDYVSPYQHIEAWWNHYIFLHCTLAHWMLTKMKPIWQTTFFYESFFFFQLKLFWSSFLNCIWHHASSGSPKWTGDEPSLDPMSDLADLLKCYQASISETNIAVHLGTLRNVSTQFRCKYVALRNDLITVFDFSRWNMFVKLFSMHCYVCRHKLC